MEKVKKFLSADEINNSLAKYLNEAVFEIINLRFSQGLKVLKHCESKLEVLINQGVAIDKDIILPILNNIALCYQSMGDLEGCSAYLEACIYNSQYKAESGSPLSTSGKIRKNRYLSLLNIQLSSCFSRLNQSKQAVNYANLAVKQNIRTLKLCISAITDLKSKKNSLFQKKPQFFTRSLTLLQTLLLQMQGKKINLHLFEANLRSELGVQKVSDWIYSLTFEKIIEIKPLLLNDLKAPHSLQAEFSKDFMLDKICMCAASCYMYSKEIFNGNKSMTKAKMLHAKAIEISTSFFPKTCPFLCGLVEEYAKTYRKNAKSIKDFKVSVRSLSLKGKRNSVQPQEVVLRLSTPKKVGVYEKKHLKRVCSARNKPSHTEIKAETGKADKETPLASPNRIEKTEPEPPLSEQSEDDMLYRLNICSNDLYGNYSSEEEVDKYEYMPLRRNLKEN